MSDDSARVIEPCEVGDADVVLRPTTQADRQQVLASASDPDIARWNPLTPTPEDWFDRRLDWSSSDHASWVIASRDDPATVLGATSLHHVDFDQLNSEVGYWIVAEFRGRGLGTRALTLASRFGFEQLGMRRIHLFHAVGNIASCRVATRAGFLLEGTHRESYRFGDGVWHDEHCHARLSTDSI